MGITIENKNRFRFNKTSLAAVKCPKGKSKRRVHDTETPGLSMLVTANGARTYYLYRFVNGRPVEIKIDTADRITPEQARDAADALNAKLRKGENPQAEKVAAREAGTLGEMWAAYRQRMAEKKRPRTLAEDDGLWTRYLSPWAGRRVAEISVELVEKQYHRIAGGKLDRSMKDKNGRVRTIRGGATAANRMLSLLSGMFTACGRAFGVAGFNPCSGVHKSVEKACERYLDENELPPYWLALKAEDETVRDMLKMALFTAARRSTLFSMRWAEINLPFKAWTIPADKMKSGTALVVPLVPAAVELLEKRKASAKSEWVFPADGAAAGHIADPQKAIIRVYTTAGVPAVTLHDLRRSTATWMNSTDSSESTIAALLAHKYKNVTGIYAKATEDTKRTGLTKAVDAMLGCVAAHTAKATAAGLVAHRGRWIKAAERDTLLMAEKAEMERAIADAKARHRHGRRDDGITGT